MNNLKNLMPKNKVFSAALMFEGIKQTKALGICALIMTLLVSCAKPVSIITNELTPKYISSIGLADFAVGIFLLWAIFPIFLVMALFRFMNRRDASDFYHAIPLNRICVYTSYSAAVAFWGIISVVLSSIVSYILYPLNRFHFGVPFDFVGKTILAVLIATLLSMSVTLLAKGLSGTEFSNIIITGLIMFAPRILLMFFSETAISGTYVIPASTIKFANPTLNILLVPFSNRDYGSFEEVITRPSTLIYSLILAIVYYILGLVVHKFRKSETAGASASYRGVQIAVRSIIGFIPVLPLCAKMAIKESSVTTTYWLITVIISLFLYFIYELVTTKNGKKLLASVPMYLIVVGLGCAFMFGSATLKNSMLNDVPTISEIESVSISSPVGYSTYNDFKSQSYKFRDTDMIKVLQNALAENVDYIEKNNSIDYIYENNYERHMIVFHTTFGKDIERTIYIDKSEMDIVLSCISKDKDYLKKVTALPKDIQGIGFSSYIDSIKEGSFDDFEAWHIYEQEYSALTDEQKLKVLRYDLENKIEIGTFYIYAYINNDTLNLCLPLTKEWFPKTYEFLIEKSS